MTRYEIAIRDNGRATYLVGYTPRLSRRGLLDAMRKVGPAIVDRLGITDSDVLTLPTQPRPFCQVGGWRIGFTGRTQRDAKNERPLPWIAAA
jgi:hypothetical protein